MGIPEFRTISMLMPYVVSTSPLTRKNTLRIVCVKKRKFLLAWTHGAPLDMRLHHLPLFSRKKPRTSRVMSVYVIQTSWIEGGKGAAKVVRDP
jgi:hypothetical protein